MPKLSPRLGYYIVSLGTVIQFLGLSGDSWLSGSSGPARARARSASRHPGDVLLVIGMAVTVLGVLLGFFSLAETMPNEPGRSPRLLPALPLVLLVGLSIGSVSFAYQAGANPSNSVAGDGSHAGGRHAADATPFIFVPGPDNCPEGTLWHPVMGHCMTPEAIAALQNATCPVGFTLDPGLLTCLPSSAGRSTPTGGSSGDGIDSDAGLPERLLLASGDEPLYGDVLGPVCPAGYQWSTSLLSCTATSSNGTITTPSPSETPACPDGSFWHPTMAHCMSTVCPPGFEFDYTVETCVQVARPTSTPLPSGTPVATPNGRNAYTDGHAVLPGWLLLASRDGPLHVVRVPARAWSSIR